MPASIAHMIISRKVREKLKIDPGISNPFREGLEKYPEYMELGSVGPDLPYYESMAKGAVDMLFQRSDQPKGVDQWSYQLHSKDPNIFPLKMIEIIWKETAIEKEDWDDDDHKKFAFACGFLTHTAADQIIHPIVNLIAGPYYKRGDSREKHRECEVHQDVYLYKLFYSGTEFKDEKFNTWCDIAQGWSSNTPITFRYLIQKAFVEAHAVMPSEDSIEDWVDGTLTILRLMEHVGPYVKANERIGNPDDPKVKEYIALEVPGDADEDKKKEYAQIVGSKRYLDFFNDAIELSIIYVKAAHGIYNAENIDDPLRRKFTSVVQNADLGAPLEKNILDNAKKALIGWQQ